MNEKELQALVERMIKELAGELPTPQVKGSDYKTIQNVEISGEILPDITEVDLRKQYLVKNPEKGPAFLALKARTPARIGLGRAGTRYRTETMLRMRADHAAAQDSVFSMVHEGFAKEHDLIPIHTLCESKDEYLTRPDKGRRFDEHNQKIIKEVIGSKNRIVIAIGDGLSAKAIESNAIDCMEAIKGGLRSMGLEPSKGLFIRYCRVGASDHIGSLTDAEVVCLLVGERPGLVTAESMSAYITYQPRIGIPESKRTVISNIHRQGTTAVEAGAHIAELIKTMLEKKASGVELAQMERRAGA